LHPLRPIVEIKLNLQFRMEYSMSHMRLILIELLSNAYKMSEKGENIADLYVLWPLVSESKFTPFVVSIIRLQDRPIITLTFYRCLSFGRANIVYTEKTPCCAHDLLGYSIYDNAITNSVLNRFTPIGWPCWLCKKMICSSRLLGLQVFFPLYYECWYLKTLNI
jgi:hypothetical protein